MFDPELSDDDDPIKISDSDSLPDLNNEQLFIKSEPYIKTEPPDPSEKYHSGQTIFSNRIKEELFQPKKCTPASPIRVSHTDSLPDLKFRYHMHFK